MQKQILTNCFDVICLESYAHCCQGWVLGGNRSWYSSLKVKETRVHIREVLGSEPALTPRRSAAAHRNFSVASHPGSAHGWDNYAVEACMLHVPCSRMCPVLQAVPPGKESACVQLLPSACARSGFKEFRKHAAVHHRGYFWEAEG